MELGRGWDIAQRGKSDIRYDYWYRWDKAVSMHQLQSLAAERHAEPLNKHDSVVGSSRPSLEGVWWCLVSPFSLNGDST
jgi:hypothetical protein